MRQTLYSVLGLPSTATRPEIRAAYRRQLGRIRKGELSSSQRPLIERACAILDDPSRRVSYDVEMAELPRWERPPAMPPRRNLRVLAPVLAASVALAAVLGTILIVLPSRSARQAPSPTQTIVSRVVTEPVATPESPAIAEESNQPDENLVAETTGPAESVASVQPAQIVTARSAPAQRPPARIPAAAAVEPGVSVAATAAPAEELVEAPATSGLAAPALVQSSPYGRSKASGSTRLSLRVPGWFCHDATGGEIFVSAGAPLPSGVSC